MWTLIHALSTISAAKNPLKAHVGMADPHLHIFNDTVRVCCTPWSGTQSSSTCLYLMHELRS